MKKFIALLISASIIAAPVAFAADESNATQDANMQPLTNNDQVAPAANPAAKKHHGCHCKKCAHKHHSHAAKKAAPTAEQAPAAQ